MKNLVTHAVGLIGRGIGASRSPAIHEAAASELALPLTYRIVDFDVLRFDDDKLSEIVRLLAGMGWSGCNVTHPFKQKVMAVCDTVSAEAGALGAVNTLLFRDGRIIGDNTDWIGFSDLIRQQIGDVGDSRVAQVGAGGAGSATAYALARLGVAELALYDPSRERCEQLVDRLAPMFAQCRFEICDSVEAALTGRQGIVQTTPVGMAAHPGTPFAPHLMQPDQWLADIIYFPAETELLAQARGKGMLAVNGMAMVIGQAAEAFRLFTGQVASRDRMLASLFPDPACGGEP